VIGALHGEGRGGFGGTGFDIAVVFEQLGRGLVVEPFLASAVLAGSAIAAAGNDRPAAAAGRHPRWHAHRRLRPCRARLALRAGARLHAAQRQAQGWVLDGAKAVVLHGEAADVFVVSARTSGEVDDEAGISLFLVTPMRPASRCAAIRSSTAAARRAASRA
jgi:alkylation response protein AidB-like acyl-CoA dehydrogenase